MKKFSIYGMLALAALGFTACDDYEEPNPAPQTNPQSAILQTADVTSSSRVTTDVYDLATMNSANEMIAVSDIVLSEALPEGYTLSVTMQAAGNADFQNAGEIPATVTMGEGNTSATVAVSADDVQGFYYDNVTKDPANGKVYLRYLLNTVCGKQVAVVGGPQNLYGPYEITVKPFAPTKVIESSYFLVKDGDLKNAIELKNSGASPYDDPVFAGLVQLTPGYKWYVVPASVKASGKLEGAVYGTYDGSEDALTGALVLVSEGGKQGAPTISDPYLCTVNMRELTYDFAVAYPQLYTPGNSNGWNQGASQILTTTDYVNYSGYAYLNGEFKFSTQADWNGVNLGSTGEEGKLTNDGGAGNLNSGSEGLFWCNVNLPALTYSLAKVSTYGLIGDATPSGWDASTPLTPSADFLKWTATVTLKDGELKFRANDAWDINLGGALENLTPGGDNIKSPGAGTYVVTLDLSKVPYSASIVKK